jgi:glycosyltransferase involved in cell wall biosynthesis
VGAAPGPDLEEVARAEGVAVHAIPFERQIHPLQDARALAAIVRLLRCLRPHVVNAGTPQAGLLGMLAARWAGVPLRIYTLRGLRLETARGARRALLAAAERRAAGSAHLVVSVSASLARRAAELRLLPGRELAVLGHGSSNGVDCERFRPVTDGAEARGFRWALSIPDGAPVVGFVGRFTRDKGIVDLADSFFGPLSERFPEVRLLLLGDFEEGDPVPPEVRSRLTRSPRVVRMGFVDDTSPYYALMDVLAFPSYREGFPNAPLEAAASGVPVAGYAATGTVDAVESGHTGTLVPVGARADLADALRRYLEDPALRSAQGAAGRERAVAYFARERVWRDWLEIYSRMLAERGLPTPNPTAH